MTKAVRISYQAIGHIRGHAIGQFKTLRLSAHTHHPEGIFHKISQVEGRTFQFKFVGFDLGKIKQIVNQGQQGVGG